MRRTRILCINPKSASVMVVNSGHHVSPSSMSAMWRADVNVKNNQLDECMQVELNPFTGIT